MAFQALADQIRALQLRLGSLQGNQSTLRQELRDEIRQLQLQLDVINAHRARLPYAQASGTASAAASGYTTVTFPAGRFTKPPAVVAANGHQSNVGVSRVVNVTETSFQVGIWAISGVQVAGSGIHWTATQETA